MAHPTDSTVRFEPCAGFRSDDDPLVCTCGWLDDDHAGEPGATVVAIGRRRPRVIVPERRAS